MMSVKTFSQERPALGLQHPGLGLSRLNFNAATRRLAMPLRLFI
jgi:hypothetical protein